MEVARREPTNVVPFTTFDRVPWDSRWRQIPIFPTYWINQYGNVFNMRLGEILRPYRNTHNVACVRMYSYMAGPISRGYSRSINKLVKEAFPEQEKN